MRPTLLIFALLLGCYEETDYMTFRDDIEPWASGTANVTTPTSGEIALGHPVGTVADSGWVNERSGMRDAGINDVRESAQASSSWSPTADAGADRARMAAEWQHNKEYSTTDPDGTACRLYLSDGYYAVTSGWNYDTNKGCVYMAKGGETGEIYRVNTWEVGSLARETMDLDMTFVESISYMASDGDNLYIAYANSSTSTYHIAQLSLTAWTGLAVADQDTGWANDWWSSTGLFSWVELTIPRPGVVGAFFADDISNTPAFGVWTVGTSWVTGSGTIGSVVGTLEHSIYVGPHLTSNYDGMFALLRTSNDNIWVVSCDVDNPSTVSYVPPAFIIGTVALAATPTSQVVQFGLRALKDQLLWVDDIGSIVSVYAASWGAIITLRLSSSSGLDRDTSAHHASIVIDGDTRLWVQYRLAGSATISGNESLISMIYASGEFGYNSIDRASSTPPQSFVPQNSTSASDEGKQWLVNDGRNMVSVENVGDGSTTLKVITAPGMR